MQVQRSGGDGKSAVKGNAGLITGVRGRLGGGDDEARGRGVSSSCREALYSGRAGVDDRDMSMGRQHGGLRW